MNEIVDIIIPIYNTPPKLLEDCFCSVFAQTYKNINIIAIDDGSTNTETAKVIKKYADNAKILLYRQKNAGVSSARNIGLKKSKGKYIYFLDSDDQIRQNYISKLVEIAKRHKVDLVFSGKEDGITGKNDAPFHNHRILLENDSDDIVMSSAFTCSAVLIKGEIARSIRFTESASNGEDIEYIVKAMSKGKSYFSGDGGFIYIYNSGSITHKKDISSVKKYLNDSIVIKNAFENYLSASSETIKLYSYLKIIRAHQKLCTCTNAKASKLAINEHINKYSLQTPKARAILRCRFLSGGEKMKILLARHNIYLPTYCLIKARSITKRHKK